MKCPECAQLCSDLRDLCPKCFADLRPAKLAAGVTPTHPELSYEDLLARAIDRARPPGAPGPGGIFGAMREFFSHPKQSKRPERGGQTEPEPIAPLPPRIETRPPRFAPPGPPDEIEPIQADFERAPQPEYPAEPESAPLPPAEFDPPVEAPVPSIADDESTAMPPAEAFEHRSDEPPPLPQNEGPDELRPPIEDPAPAPHSDTLDWYREPEPMPSPDPVGELFIEADRELSSRSAGELFEVSLLQFEPPAAARGEIEVLFDLAAEAIDDPAAEQRYVRRIETSAARKIDAAALARKLAQVEKAFDVPVFSLRRGSGQRRGEAQPAAEPHFIPIPPTAGKRFVAAALDLGYAALLALIISAAVLWFTEEGFRPRLVEMRADLLDLISVAALFCATVPAIYILYLFTSRGGTLGERWAGLELKDLRGREPAGKRRFMRAALLPLSALLFGWIPALAGRPPLHEILSKTRVTLRSRKSSAIA